MTRGSPPLLRASTVPLDGDGDLLGWVPDGPATVWLRAGEGFVAWGEAARIEVGVGPDRFRRSAFALADLMARCEVDAAAGAGFGRGPIAFGSFSFDPRSADSVVVVPEVVVGQRDGQQWTTVAGDRPAPAHPAPPAQPPVHDRVRYAGSSMPDLQWLDAVAVAVARIEQGSLDKVVLARDEAVWSRVPFDARVLLRRLSERFPDCYTFLLGGLIGATPELLVRRVDRRVESLVLAGSAARGVDEDQDRGLGKALLGSEKDRAEHALAVESVRSVLDPLCERLTVEAQPSLLRLANVQHLATAVRGRLAGTPPPSALDLAGALHPTAAVCGTPTDAALAVIRELEGMDRGRYSGPVGWMDTRGDGEWGIALRCAELSGARARLFAGAGIVAGSLPEAELEETRLKLRAMHAALAG